MTIGFIGTGIISSYVVTGFCKSGREGIDIIVSPRSRDKSAALAAEFPQMVRVARDNQQVVDEAEWIFIAVLPEQALDVIRELTFTPEKKVINLVPMLDFQKVREIAGPLKLLVDVVPLPFCSRGIGPVVLNPPVDEVKELLSAIGTVVAVERPEQMALLRTVTALMSPYYMLLAKMVGWCCDNGLDEPTARAYVTSFTGALSQVAADWPEPLEDLAGEMTPGGLNWQALEYLKGQDNFAEWQKALQDVLERISKK